MTGERVGTAGIRYRPEIDGLRALAVVTVVLLHMAPHLPPGGVLGVDVLLVSSSDLITSVMQRELEAGSSGSVTSGRVESGGFSLP
jgi:peptidoglycan/LPS O-acetylase OafA/YrhL